MGILGKALRGLGVLAVAASALVGFQAPAASAATGTVLADLTPPGSPGGVSVAFDGQYLYYTDLGGAVLHRMAPNGTPGTDIPILGGVGVNAITYDASKDLFWGVDATGLNVYQISKDGWAGLEFTIIPVLDLPGSCNVLSGCSPTVTGLAYDATTDSLWYLPQGSQRVYHFNTAGELLGYFDTNDVPDCATNAATGIAAGASVLYVTAGSCSRAFQYGKSDSGTGAKLSSFSIEGVTSAGTACDNVTFSSTTAMWVRDAGNGHLRAIQIPSGTCVFGGGVAIDLSLGWMTGAGAPIADFPVGATAYHAFHLLCGPANGGPPTPSNQPNNWVANWKDDAGNHYSFHLERVDNSSCTFTTPTPPACNPPSFTECNNQIFVQGIGRLRGRGPNGQTLNIGGPCNPATNNTGSCGQLNFVAVDHGEPNTKDEGNISIDDPVSQQQVLFVGCSCFTVRYMAHLPQ